MNSEKKPQPAKKVRQRRRRNKKQTKVIAPIAVSVKTRNVDPVFKQTRDGCTITHREYISDISAGSSAFLINTFNVNSGLVSSFPWLSQVASRFESYTFERLNYIYEPMVPTTTPGSIMMAIDFDAADSTPANKVTLMAYSGATRASVFSPVRLSTAQVNRKKMVHERYVRSGALNNGDIKTYDVGNLFVATVGTPAAQTLLGELYVEYTVKLRTPQIQTAPNLSLSGRRAAQQGTITYGRDGVITSHVAEVTGEGNQPVMQAVPGESTLQIDPRIKRCLLSLYTTPSANWVTSGVSTCLTMLTGIVDSTGGQYGILGDGSLPVQSTRRRMLTSDIAANPGQTTVATTTRPLIEHHIIGEGDDDQQYSGTSWGQMVDSIILGIRDNMNGSGSGATFKTDYSLFPLDVDSWPKIKSSFTNIINGNVAFNTAEKVSKIIHSPIGWPTLFDSIPVRSTIEYRGQQFGFGRKIEIEPKK